MNTFDGTNITIDKLKSIIPTINIDGTIYPIEDWIKEAEIIINLPIGSQVWIPYNKMEYGKLKETIYEKRKFKDYSYCTQETKDWWILEPYMIVESLDGDEYYVYEYTFYKNIKHKVRYALAVKQRKPKRKFLTRQEIVEFKKKAAINNRKLRNKKL